MLKGCPFCGIEPNIGVRCIVNNDPYIPRLSYAEQIYNQKWEWIIECENCNVRMTADSMDECIEHWNRRVIKNDKS